VRALRDFAISDLDYPVGTLANFALGSRPNIIMGAEIPLIRPSTLTKSPFVNEIPICGLYEAFLGRPLRRLASISFCHYYRLTTALANAYSLLCPLPDADLARREPASPVRHEVLTG
jgi:hypothetical protein